MPSLSSALSMCTATTSPSTSQVSTAVPSAPCSCCTCVQRHSKVTRLSATRGGRTSVEARGVRPASTNSSTSGGTAAQVVFIASARSRVARFHTNSPVACTLRTVSLRPMLAKPTMGGT